MLAEISEGKKKKYFEFSAASLMHAKPRSGFKKKIKAVIATTQKAYSKAMRDIWNPASLLKRD